MNIRLPLLLTAILILSAKLWAQQVPSRMEFANMDLRLTDGAIRDIQADVDALTRSEKYFQTKLERVDMYLPIIERIFKEEGLPDDFKYLVIQESALISDAVSSSNAVGFWQFKEISGLENDLRIDRYVDERMNIVSSSRAAATYLKDHNKYFDNWAYALIAYQRGRGGAADVIDESNFGKTRLRITSDTYWYLKKFLAHKVAFENTLGSSKPQYYLKEIDEVQGKSLKSISKEENIPVELLEEYNKWIKRGKVPEDKNYTVIVPLSNLEKIKKLQSKKKIALEELPGDIDDSKQRKFPLVDNYPSRSDRSIPHEVEINGLDGIYAPVGYTVKKLASTADLDEYKFRKYNDLKIMDKLKTGEIYYLRRKRNRAKFYYHTVAQNETMWEISQKYGIKLKKLYRKNRMEAPEQAKPGRVLWLRHNRPASVEVEYRQAPKLDNEPEVERPAVTEPLDSKTEARKEETNIKIIERQEEFIRTDSVQLDSLQAVSSDIPQSEDTTFVEQNFTKNESIDSLAINDEKEQLAEENSSTKLQEIETDIDEIDEEREEFDKNDFSDYSIKKGDTFFSIANRFNMKISTLLNVNELGIRDTLSIGQIIKVNTNGYIAEAQASQEDSPSETAHQEEPLEVKNNNIEHKVVAGDTMYSIAKEYKVSLKEIMKWNNKEDYNLKQGELILIKRK